MSVELQAHLRHTVETRCGVGDPCIECAATLRAATALANFEGEIRSLKSFIGEIKSALDEILALEEPGMGDEDGDADWRRGYEAALEKVSEILAGLIGLWVKRMVAT